VRVCVEMLVDMKRARVHGTCWFVAVGISADLSSGVDVRMSVPVRVCIHMSDKMSVNMRSNMDIGVPRGRVRIDFY